MEIEVLDYLVSFLSQADRKTRQGWINFYSFDNLIGEAEKNLNKKIDETIRFKILSKIVSENLAEYVGDNINNYLFIANAVTYTIAEQGGYRIWRSEIERIKKLEKEGFEAGLLNAIKESKLKWIGLATLIIATLSLITSIVAIFV